MHRITIRIVSPREWIILADLFGDGKVPALGMYVDLSALNYPGHHIAQGVVRVNGRNLLSENGFLRFGGMSVFGSVNRLPLVPLSM